MVYRLGVACVCPDETRSLSSWFEHLRQPSTIIGWADQLIRTSPHHVPIKLKLNFSVFYFLQNAVIKMLLL
jgi:hypothetical protein